MQQVRGESPVQPRGIGTGVTLLLLLVGMAIGAALTRALSRRATPPGPSAAREPVAALPTAPRPAPGGRHAWVPPAGDGSDAG